MENKKNDDDDDLCLLFYIAWKWPLKEAKTSCNKSSSNISCDRLALLLSLLCVYHNGMFHIKIFMSTFGYFENFYQFWVTVALSILSIYHLIKRKKMLTLQDGWNLSFHFGYNSIMQPKMIIFKTVGNGPNCLREWRNYQCKHLWHNTWYALTLSKLSIMNAFQNQGQPNNPHQNSGMMKGVHYPYKKVGWKRQISGQANGFYILTMQTFPHNFQ